LAALLAAAFMLATASAVQVADTSRSDTKIPVGSVIEPKASLDVRDRPPGFFTPKGNAIGQARPGEHFRILEKREIPTLLGAET
jgi:hypothetical protein